MAEGYVRVPPDDTGKRIDTTEKLNADALTVERQRVEIPDGVNVGGDLLTRMLVEQRIQNMLLVEGMKLDDDIEGLRDDLSDVAGLEIPDTRELLSAARTYYVSTTGSDTNSGLSSTDAFLTVSNALSVTRTIDANGNSVTIQLGAGTFAEIFLSAPLVVGTTTITIQGVDTAGTSILGDGANYLIFQTGGTGINYKNLKIQGGIYCDVGGFANISTGVAFGACTGAPHLQAYPGGTIYLDSAYSITGAAPNHLLSSGGGYIEQTGACTITGVLAFTTFCQVERNAVVLANGTFTGGTVTGKRYAITNGGLIDTTGGGANYFPGNSAGTPVPTTLSV